MHVRFQASAKASFIQEGLQDAEELPATGRIFFKELPLYILFLAPDCTPL